jgi:hypothetical protein
MIPDYKLYHGAVLADIVDRFEGAVAIAERVDAGRLLNYVLNDRIGIQIKYATAKLRPWLFSFPSTHIEQIHELMSDYPVSFVVLVCRTDGVACIPSTEAVRLLSRDTNGVSWLRLDRRKREMYRVFGPQGELEVRLQTTCEPIVAALRSLEPPLSLTQRDKQVVG